MINRHWLHIGKAGFSTTDYAEAFCQQYIKLEYRTLKDLAFELKSVGAHNVNNGRLLGLMGKQRMCKFKAAFERQRNAAGLLPATYQCWYGVLQRPLI